MKLTLADNLVLGLIFTIISIIRTYGVRRLFNRWHQHQTRLHSLIEVTANTTIGIVTSIASQMIIFPLYGVNISFLDNVIISLTFLIISIARGYVLRRAFNRWHQHVNNAGRINFDAKDIGLNAVIVQPVSGHNFDKPASQS
jgi:membrane protein implicated in regulation of membrane protease activity